jgi:hypothetical protein
LTGQQLGLALDPDEPPRAPRAGVLRHAHLQGQPLTVGEALFLERKAARQDALVLAVFQALPGEPLTPTGVLLEIIEREPPPAPLLTSIRRSLTNLTRRGLLVHDKRDRRPGPRGARESTWRLA